MAVSGTTETINTELRDSLQQNITEKVDTFKTTVGTNPYGLWVSSGALAGVTPLMGTKIVTALEDYKTNLELALKKMTSPDINKGFKGAKLEASLKTFVDSVIAEAQAYTNHLVFAQNQIIWSVKQTYGIQIEAVASSVTSDASFGSTTTS